jgi:iron complex outermembrane receptor protein
MLGVLGLAAGVYSSHAHGEPPAAASGGGRLAVVEEVVVTAQRLEENAQSVPIAITALTAEDLEARQVNDVEALAQVAPNLDIAPGQANSLTLAINIRGQVEVTNVPTVDPAVGLFLDGNYIARVTGANLNLVDIERVEILRGPQGTLFGRNTIGGAINIVPNKPEKAFGGTVELLAGNYDRYALTGVLNAPVLGERGAVRIAAQHTEHSGFARTVVLDEDLNDDNTDFVRAQFRLSPEDRWDLNLALDYSDTSAHNQWITMLAAEAPATLLPAASGHPEDSMENYRDPVTTRTHASYDGGFDSRTRGASATFTWPLATHTLKGIVAFRDLDQVIVGTDLDGTPYDVATQLRQDQAERQESFELQSYGRGFNERLEWIGGLYYFDERVTRHGLANTLAPISTIENNNSGNVHNMSRSIYLQLAANLSPSLRVQAGARHVRDTRQLTSFNSLWNQGVETCGLDAAILDSPETCRATLPPRKFDYVPFNLSIDHSPRDGLLWYAKYSRGQRAGGYNFRVTESLGALPFEPETVDAWELGLKSDLLRGRLRLNTALFRTDYQDIQLTQVALDATQRPVVVNVNAGSARIEGGEVEVTASLRRAVLALGVGHIEARYTQLDPGVIDVTLDSKFRNTPEWTVSAAIDLPFNLQSAATNLHVDYSWRDDTYYGGNPLARRDEVDVVNARISTQLAGSGVEFSVWCKNVADTRYIARAVASGNGFIRALPADPRTYGATLTYRFGAA